MKLLKVTPTDGGSVRALVELETPDGEIWNCRIVKQPEVRAWLDTQPHRLTHRQFRHLQREAVKQWADMIGDSLEGLLESERGSKGSEFRRLGVQLKEHCFVCDRNTPSEFSDVEGAQIKNACYFCGTQRKGRPFISRAEATRIKELNARQGTGEPDDLSGS